MSNRLFINTFWRVIVEFGKVGFGSAMRINNMNYAHDPYELEVDAMGENIELEVLKQNPMGEEISGDSPRYCSHHEKPKGGVAKLQRRQ